MNEPQKIFRTQDVPNTPGVYVYRDTSGTVIYVGKARNLRRRMSSYFRPSTLKRNDPKLNALIHSITSYEIFPVATEAEALLLETQFIKQYAPHYNILMRDDKRFLHIKLDLSQKFPRLELERLRKEDHCIYIGPFPQAQALRNTVDFLSKRYGLRTCPTYTPTQEDYIHCLEHTVRECLCPCIGKVTSEEYHNRIEQILSLFKGEGIFPLISELTTEMNTLAQNLKFEEAASLRDIISNLKSILEPARRFANQTIITRHTTRNIEGMEELQHILHLEKLPIVMECFDMANISGTLAVGSMVCFRNGRPDTSSYRRFKIRSQEAADDTAFMQEVLERRYTRLLRENQTLPDFILLDGGHSQVATGTRVFTELKMDIPYFGLAERQEIIILPTGEEIELPRNNKGLQLLQAIRDEAHRFANGFHRQLRNKRIYDSLLNEIPGIGQTRKIQLLKEFGSVRELAKHTADEIRKKVPGIGQELANNIVDYLKNHLGKGQQ